MKGMLGYFIVFVFLPVVIGFSYWLFISGVVGATRMIMSRNWKTIEGAIVDGGIYFKSFGSKADGDFRVHFAIIIEYGYSVMAKKYRNNQYYASDSLFLSEYKPISKLPKKEKNSLHKNELYLDAKERINNGIGKPIMIFYNPRNPSRSCLNNSFNKGILLNIGMGLLFVILTTLFVLKIILQ